MLDAAESGERLKLRVILPTHDTDDERRPLILWLRPQTWRIVGRLAPSPDPEKCPRDFS
jgi:hypothetical protein